MGEFVGSEMADEQAVIDENVEEVTEVDEAETPEPEGEESAESEEETELVVTIGDESPTSEEEQEQAAAPEWVRELRKAHREDKKRIRELEEKLNAQTAEIKPAALGNKPKLEDFDYDSERFEKELESWYERKREHDAAQAKARDAEEAQKREWQAKLDAYNAEKSKLRVRDYEDAEMVAQESLNVTQQGIILHGSDNPALLTYAIGKNPKKAKELAAIQDPVKFAFAVAKLEKELKVSNRKAPPPERVVSGSGSTSPVVTGSNLDRLKAEAQRTGDYEAYFAAKRQAEARAKSKSK